MKITKVVLALLVVGFIGIQFIRPELNVQQRNPGKSIFDMFPVSDTLHKLLTVACLDCHSDSTRYPWYASIQPSLWFLSNHVHEGKRNLNFDEYATYRPFRQFGKLVQIERQLTEGEMPLSSYLLIHRDAVLSQEQKEMIVAWSKALRDSLKARYPPDSLERRRNGREREGGRM